MTSPDEAGYKVYQALALSIINGMTKLTSARMATLSLELVWTRLLVNGRLDETSKNRIESLTPGVMENFIYVTRISHLIYATSLLDTFLSDTTRFLFLRTPAALGGGHIITMKSVLASSSRSDLITQAVAKKVRDLSFRTFLDRIEALKDSFGLRVEQSDTDVETLEHFSSLRNTIVHDQGFIDLLLSEDGELSAIRKTCPIHPTPVSDDDLLEAIRTYFGVIRAVYDAVVGQVLHHSGNDSFQSLMDKLHLA